MSVRIGRREFVSLLVGVAAAWPRAARAQQPNRVYRVGALWSLAEDDPELKARVPEFRRALQQLGWLENDNIRIDERFAAGRADQLPPLAKELVALRPDVIVAQSTPAAVALQRETHTIPIVFVAVSDPIGSGLITSLARPGRNLTGVLYYEEGITGKWLAMLKEIAPRLVRAAFVADPAGTAYNYFLRSATAAASSLAIELVPSPVKNADDTKHVIEAFARVPNGGLILPPDITTIGLRDLVIALAARHRLPAVYALRSFVVAGGLMAYSTDVLHQYRQVASYIDRILRGANPADLPVQAPTKYETAINLKTAKALGLEVPTSIMLRADEVIE
jgi:putative ABC transport system substrate-binding protein